MNINSFLLSEKKCLRPTPGIFLLPLIALLPSTKRLLAHFFLPGQAACCFPPSCCRCGFGSRVCRFCTVWGGCRLPQHVFPCCRDSSLAFGRAPRWKREGGDEDIPTTLAARGTNCERRLSILLASPTTQSNQKLKRTSEVVVYSFISLLYKT